VTAILEFLGKPAETPAAVPASVRSALWSPHAGRCAL
jgi:hypothetical protein